MPTTAHIRGRHVDDRDGDPHRRPAVLAEAGSSARYRPASSGRSRAGRATARPRRRRRDCSRRGSASRRSARPAESPYLSSAPNLRLWITHVGALAGSAPCSRGRVLGSARSIVMPRLARLTAWNAGRRALGEGRPPAAAGVAALRVLDLDHLGAELAEDHPGIGRGDAVADLDHDEAGKRTGARHRHSFFKRRMLIPQRRGAHGAGQIDFLRALRVSVVQNLSPSADCPPTAGGPAMPMATNPTNRTWRSARTIPSCASRSARSARAIPAPIGASSRTEQAYPTEFVTELTAGRLSRLADPGGIRRLRAAVARRRGDPRGDQRLGLHRRRTATPRCTSWAPCCGTAARSRSSAICRRSPSGELRLQAFGVTEPTTGSDTTKLKTRAVREGNAATSSTGRRCGPRAPGTPT